MTDQDRIALLEEQVALLKQDLLSVAWLHHELVLGMKIAAVRKSLAGMSREDVTRRIAEELRQKGNRQPQ